MRSAFIFLLIFTLVFGTSYWYAKTSTICPVPITYRLGELDSRFPINADEAKAIFAEAEAVWEKSNGRELFVYDEQADFSINFIYDERQQLASTEEEWRMKLDVQEKNSRLAIDKVKAEAEEYEERQELYSQKRTAYEERLSNYNKKVEELNEQGGAPEPVFEELQVEQKELSNQLKELMGMEKDLDARADEINKLGEKGNQLIEDYNTEVLKYNEVYGNIDQFTQGDYKRDRINIYKFSDSTELKKVIAHEFGHALGVGHVEGEESIMYYLMEEQPDSVQLSNKDVDELLIICGDGTEFAHQARQIIRKTLALL